MSTLPAPAPDNRTTTEALLLPVALLAAVVPALMAYHQPPSATLLNQCLAVVLWGALVALMAPRLVPARGSWPLLAALALLAGSALASNAWGTLPSSLAWLAALLLAGAALLVLAGADAAQRPQRQRKVFVALAWGLLATGVMASIVALVQVFAPSWADGLLIARSSLPGRAVGNLRQPNHLCSLLLWALVAAVALHELRQLHALALAALLPLLVLAVELSASRTGAVGLLLLLLWGLLDRGLSRGARFALLATPLLYLLAWAAMAGWGELSQQALGAGARAAAEGGMSADSPNARTNIWRNTWALVLANPWFGVGFGEFNFAWSLSAFANRPTAFFDHSHNLPLQLMVELGLPLALLMLALLASALGRAAYLAWQAQGEQASMRRAGLVMLLLIGLHSLVEYPLWYAYFLLPTALALGLSLGQAQTRRGDAHTKAGQTAGTRTGTPIDATIDATTDPRAGSLANHSARSTAGLAVGVLMCAGGLFAVWDYQRVVVIYAPVDNSSSLATRIARGQLSPLFAHHADYAAATNATSAASTTLGLTRSSHALLDTRLMMAWARHLNEAGRLDEARWVAQRLSDFRNAEAATFFAPCATAAGSTAFQCQPALAKHDWRDLARLPPSLAPTPAPMPATAPDQRPASATQ